MVTPGASVSGTLTPADVDIFVVTVRGSGILTATTTGTTDTFGGIMDSSDVLAVDDDSGTDSNFRVAAAVSSGTYYIGVIGYDSSTAGEYTLMVEFSGRTGTPSSGFDIDLRYLGQGTLSLRMQRAFEHAVSFWTSAITGDLPDVNNAAGRTCFGSPMQSGIIDDLRIYVEIRPIDGRGGVLGQAGPCHVRSNYLPYAGKMTFDSADLASMDDDQVTATMVHEMAHVLGFVPVIWKIKGLLVAPSVVENIVLKYRDTHFVGPGSRAAFDEVGGRSYAGPKVPVENDTSSYGVGSLDSHWRKSVFGNEIMTPTLSPGRLRSVS